MAFNTDIFGDCNEIFYCLATWANSVTEGFFWSIILMSFGIVIFMGTFSFGVNRAFAYAGVSVGFIALIFVQMGLIPLIVMTIALILAALGIVAQFMNTR